MGRESGETLAALVIAAGVIVGLLQASAPARLHGREPTAVQAEPPDSGHVGGPTSTAGGALAGAEPEEHAPGPAAVPRTWWLTILDVAEPSAPVVVGRSAALPGVQPRVAVAEGYAYVATRTDGLYTLDVRDPKQPAVLAALATPRTTGDVAVSPPYAYVTAADRGLLVLDVADPARPAEVGAYRAKLYPSRVRVTAGHAYVGDSAGTLHVVDLSDPARPARIGAYQMTGPALDFEVVGDRGYAVAGLDEQRGSLHVIDLHDPTQPREVGVSSLAPFADGVAVYGEYAYVVSSEAGLRVIEMADPAHPDVVERRAGPDGGQRVAIAGQDAYVAADGCGLRVLDLAEPAHPVEVAIHPGRIHDVRVLGRYAYVVASEPRVPAPCGALEDRRLGGGAND
ncbi:MAG TPA: hypothetical protein VII06_13315 [Chloroflexota bacterium]|jgi:hypothetical protein